MRRARPRVEVTPIDDGSAPFGLSFFSVETADESGEADTQAGSHPFELTTSLAFNISARESPSAKNGNTEWPLSSAAPKDVEVALPPGLGWRSERCAAVQPAGVSGRRKPQLSSRHAGRDGEAVFRWGVFLGRVPGLQSRSAIGRARRARLLRVRDWPYDDLLPHACEPARRIWPGSVAERHPRDRPAAGRDLDAMGRAG